MGELSRLSSLLGFLKDRALPSTPTTDSIADVLRAIEKRAMVTTIADSLAHALGLRGDAASATGSLHAKVKDIKDNASARPAAATYFAVSSAIAVGVVLDSGPLAADEYEVLASGSHDSGSSANVAGKCDLEHRNAANDANVKAVQLTAGAATAARQAVSGYIPWPRITVALNERIRVNLLEDSIIIRAGWSLFVRKV